MKYKVEFLVTKYSGGQDITGYVIYDSELDKITTSDDKILDGLLSEDEFIIGKYGKKYSIKKDKMEFMENLKYAFTGSMFRATDIQKI